MIFGFFPYTSRMGDLIQLAAANAMATGLRFITTLISNSIHRKPMNVCSSSLVVMAHSVLDHRSLTSTRTPINERDLWPWSTGHYYTNVNLVLKTMLSRSLIWMPTPNQVASTEVTLDSMPNDNRISLAYLLPLKEPAPISIPNLTDVVFFPSI